jgi:hypothetical protein
VRSWAANAAKTVKAARLSPIAHAAIALMTNVRYDAVSFVGGPVDL